MSDLIDRRVAIENIKELFRMGDCFCDEYSIIGMLNQLPSAEPKRKQGEWIEAEKGIKVTRYKCSECGSSVMDDTGYDVSADYPFCHCGADMRGEQNDS